MSNICFVCNEPNYNRNETLATVRRIERDEVNGATTTTVWSGMICDACLKKIFGFGKERESDENQEVLPCPFCNSEPRLMANHFTDDSHIYNVKCRRCGMEGPHMHDAEQAIAAWNGLIFKFFQIKKEGENE